jgi:hypothetical protein
VNYNRLGFALQMITVRHLGMFLVDPMDVPAEVVEYVAEQLGIADPVCVKIYADRETLERLVGEGRKAADRRLWAQLTGRIQFPAAGSRSSVGPEKMPANVVEHGENA